MSTRPDLDRMFQAQADKLRLGMRESIEDIEDFRTLMELDPDYQQQPRRWWQVWRRVSVPPLRDPH